MNRNQINQNLIGRDFTRLRGGLGIFLVLASFTFSGCCVPFGPGCGPDNCYDCDGTNQSVPMGPFQGIRQQLRCGGGGCGEVYVGEWISTPPDCVDPCCDDQFVGGAVPCQTGCWTLADLFSLQRFSGRFAGGRACDDCGACGGCEACGEYIGEAVVGESYLETPVEHSGGCATCARGSNGSVSRTRFARTQNVTPRASSSTRFASQTNSANQARPTPATSNQVQVQQARVPRQIREPNPRPVAQASYQPPRTRVANAPQFVPRTGSARNRVADYDDRAVRQIRR